MSGPRPRNLQHRSPGQDRFRAGSTTGERHDNRPLSTKYNRNAITAVRNRAPAPPQTVTPPQTEAGQQKTPESQRKRPTENVMQSNQKLQDVSLPMRKKCRIETSHSENVLQTQLEDISSHTLGSIERTSDPPEEPDCELSPPKHLGLEADCAPASSPQSGLCSAPPTPDVRGEVPRQQIQDNATSPRRTLRPVSIKDHMTCPDISAPIVMLREPLTFRITSDQLIKEIKAIYSALVIVETQCIEADKAQAAAIKAHERDGSIKLDDRWPELLGLHKTLMNEHHDFLLASQHVAATAALRELATKYSMAPRLWKHAIHSMLELLRYRLPSSREFMLGFVYHTYQMMCLLYETVPGFHTIWSECAGDLARYRMAIEDEDKETREIWAEMAREWYWKTLENNVGIGRLYHHLGILAKHDSLHQLYLYSRALISETPFLAARESLLCGIEALQPQFDVASRADSAPDIALIKLHELVLKRCSSKDFRVALIRFTSLLNDAIQQRLTRWRKDGTYMIISSICVVLEYGNPKAAFRLLLDDVHSPRQGSSDNASAPINDKANHVDADLSVEFASDRQLREYGIDLLIGIVKIAVGSYTDKACRQPNHDVLDQLHLALVFMLALLPVSGLSDTSCPAHRLFREFPWTNTCKFMTALQRTTSPDKSFFRRQTFASSGLRMQYLREDSLFQGMAFARQYMLDIGFHKTDHLSDEQSEEHPEASRERISRIFWLMHQISVSEDWVIYDETRNTWEPRSKESVFDCKSSAHSSIGIDCSETSGDGSEPMTDATTVDESVFAGARTPPRVILPGQDPMQQQKSGSDIVASWFQKWHLHPEVVSDTEPEPDERLRKVVCSQNLILSDESLFDTATKDCVIVIPSKVIVRLRRQRRQNFDKDSKDYAHKAFLRITTAVMAEKNVQIWNAKSEDVTEEALAAELDPKFEVETLEKDKGIELSGILQGLFKLPTHDAAQAQEKSNGEPTKEPAAEPQEPLIRRSRWRTVICMSRATAALLKCRPTRGSRAGSQSSVDSSTTARNTAPGSPSQTAFRPQRVPPVNPGCEILPPEGCLRSCTIAAI